MDIFAANYFDDYDENYYEDATEATAIKKAIVSILGGPLGELIGNIVHSSRVKKSEVVSLQRCVQEYGDAGNDIYKNTVKFFIDNELINENLAGKRVITFKDLTPKGKSFMRGYYSCIDEIRQFDMSTAQTVSGNANAEGIVMSAATPINIARTIAKIVKMVSAHTKAAAAFSAMAGAVMSVSPQIAATLTSAASTGGSSIAITVIVGLISSTFNIAETVKSFTSSKQFKNVMRDSDTTDYQEESAYDDIFSETYFDVATESMSDIIISKSDFNYMPPKEAEKAYKGTVRMLMMSKFMTHKGTKAIDPDRNYITKSDIGFIYGVSTVKEIVKKINILHKFRLSSANEFLSELKSALEQIDIENQRNMDTLNSYSRTAMLASAMRH